MPVCRRRTPSGAAFRLNLQGRGRQISALRYDRSFDLTAADTAAGTVVIRFDRAGDSGDLVLDFRGPMLADLTVNGRPLSAEGRVDGHLALPASLLKTGPNIVSARFATPIAASGAAIIRYHDDKDGQTYLYTLLVPSDAHLLFPCFDQPDLKAHFLWTITAPSGWTVIANGPLDGQQPETGGTRWRFAETEPIELPPSEWSIDYDSLDQGRDDECLRRSTSPRRLSGSCVRLRSCWARAGRRLRRAGGSRSASRPITAGARNMAA